MNVKDLSHNGGIYKYRINIERDDNCSNAPVEDVRKWAIEQSVQCTVVPGQIYLKSEEDIVLFMLRWS